MEILNLLQQKKRNYLVSEPNYHAAKFFAENVLAIEIKKTEIHIKKTVYLGLSILELSKILMYEFWYDCVKPKYGKKAKSCYIHTHSSIVHIKTDDIYKYIAEDVEARFDTLNYELDRPLLNGKNKKVIRLMKDGLGGKIMTKFA